ncbi:hypothetical protein ACF0H5_017745 [Mactra antiquata]
MVQWQKMSAHITYNSSRLSRVITSDIQDDTSSSDYYYDIQVAQHLNHKDKSNVPARNVMQPLPNEHTEAYYLYFIAITGIILNLIVVITIFIRKPLRKMTSGFLVHACFLDFIKSAYCIPIATNLLSQTSPSDCNLFGATYVILVTISVFNMVAMVCTEAYTFGEKNIGGNSRGTVICITFGVALVYVGSIILHLGPTLIGGHFEFQPDIGSCSFSLGQQKGYVANVMWAVITTVAVIAVIHFIRRLYLEIQINRPNRVSFLVRTSITVLDTASSSTCRLRKIIRDATHRAKIFILNVLVFIICWYPYFMLLIIDKSFKASPKAYQGFAFIAWSHGAIQPILYILFDRNLNILARRVYCDKYDIDHILQHMINRQRNPDQTNPKHRHSFSDPDAAVPSFTIHDSDNRRRNLVDIIRQHQDICVVQNSSNQDVHNRVTNPNIQNIEILDLTSQLAPTSNIPPENLPSSYHQRMATSRGFHPNVVENPTYINRVDTTGSEGFTTISRSDTLPMSDLHNEQNVIYTNEDHSANPELDESTEVQF